MNRFDFGFTSIVIIITTITTIIIKFSLPLC